MRPSLIIALAALVATTGARTLRAQDSASVAVPLKIDLGVGAATGRGGGLRDIRGGVGANLLAVAPLRKTRRGTLVAGLTGHAHLTLDFGTQCTVRPPDNKCTPHYPHFSGFGGVVGLDFARRKSDGGARLLVGPAAIKEENSRRALGWQARADAALKVTSGFALVAWSHASTVSLYRQRFTMLAFGVGVRLQ